MKKWEKGEVISDPKAACAAVLDGDVLFHCHKPQNPGWLQNWSIYQIGREARAGHIFTATPANKEADQ